MRRAFLLGFRRQLIDDAQRPREQVEVDAEQPLGRLAAHRVRDGGAHVAPLGDVARVAEAIHQLRPRAGDAAGVPAELGRLAREAVARQGRQHQVECVLGGAAVRGRVGQGTDGLEQLDDRAGPAVRHDQRQRVLMPGPDVDEVDLHPVDLGRELRQRVQSCLALAPVVLGRPVAGELPQRRQLHALRPILDELLGGPACRRDAPAEIDELLLRDLNFEGLDVIPLRRKCRICGKQAGRTGNGNPRCGRFQKTTTIDVDGFKRISRDHETLSCICPIQSDRMVSLGVVAWMLDHVPRSLALIVRAFDGEPAGLTRDDVLDNATLFWLTNSTISAARLYWEATDKKTNLFGPKNVTIPVVVSVFTDEV